MSEPSRPPHTRIRASLKLATRKFSTPCEVGDTQIQYPYRARARVHARAPPGAQARARTPRAPARPHARVTRARHTRAPALPRRHRPERARARARARPSAHAAHTRGAHARACPRPRVWCLVSGGSTRRYTKVCEPRPSASAPPSVRPIPRASSRLHALRLKAQRATLRSTPRAFSQPVRVLPLDYPNYGRSPARLVSRAPPGL